MNDNIQVLDLVEVVFKRSEDSKLKPEVFELLENELAVLSKQFMCSKIEVFFIANILCLNLEGNWISINDLKNHFDCKLIDMIKFNKELISLLNSIFFDIESFEKLNSILNSSIQFRCSNEIYNNIIDVYEPDFNNVSDVGNEYNFIEDLFNLLEEDNEELPPSLRRIENRKGIDKYILRKVDKIVTKHKNHSLNNFFEKHNFDAESKLIFAHTLWLALIGKKGVDVKTLCDLILGVNTLSVAKFQEIMLGEHILIKNNFLEFEELKFIGSALVLSNKTCKELEASGFKIYRKSKNKRSFE